MNEQRGPHIEVELTLRGVEGEERLRERAVRRCAAWADRLVRDGLCTIDVSPLHANDRGSGFEARARLVSTDAAADVSVEDDDAGRAVERALERIEQEVTGDGGA